VFRKSRRASRRGGRFRHVSKVEASFLERWSISSCFRNRGELLGEEGDFVVFQKVEASFSERRAISSCFRKSRRASRLGGRFRHVSESRGELLGEEGDFVVFQKVEASFSERRAISPSFESRGELLGEEGDFVVFQKSRGASRRGGRFRHVSGISAGFSARWSISSWFENSRRASRRGGRFRHVSEISAGSRLRWSISSCFRIRGGVFGEGAIFSRFQRKAAVGRAVVWTVARLAKTWQRRCTCASNVLNVSGFKATR
jgi:hypothetical protein